MTLSATALTAALADNIQAAPPAVLVHTTVRAALVFASDQAAVAGGLSIPAVALAEGVLTNMFTTRLSFVAVVLFALTVVGSGAGVLTSGWQSNRAGSEAQAAGRPANLPAATKDEKTAATELPADRLRPQKVSQAEAASERQERLLGSIDFDGIDDPKATLLDVLDQLRSKVSIDVRRE